MITLSRKSYSPDATQPHYHTHGKITMPEQAVVSPVIAPSRSLTPVLAETHRHDIHLPRHCCCTSPSVPPNSASSAHNPTLPSRSENCPPGTSALPSVPRNSRHSPASTLRFGTLSSLSPRSRREDAGSCSSLLA